MGGISCPSTASSSRVFPGPWTQARGSSSAPDSPALRCLWQAADAQTLMTHLSARALRLPRSHSCVCHGEIAGAGDSDGKGVSDVDCLVLPRTGGDADPDAAVLVTQWCACAEPLAARAAHRRSSQDCPCSSLPRCLVPFPFFATTHAIAAPPPRLLTCQFFCATCTPLPRTTNVGGWAHIMPHAPRAPVARSDVASNFEKFLISKAGLPIKRFSSWFPAVRARLLAVCASAARRACRTAGGCPAGLLDACCACITHVSNASLLNPEARTSLLRTCRPPCLVALPTFFEVADDAISGTSADCAIAKLAQTDGTALNTHQSSLAAHIMEALEED